MGLNIVLWDSASNDVPKQFQVKMWEKFMGMTSKQKGKIRNQKNFPFIQCLELVHRME